MKDYKVLLGWAFILFAVGFVLRSVAIAYASPYGPNVSMGSNPIINISVGCSSSPSPSWTNETTQNAVFTDFSIAGGSTYSSDIRVNNSYKLKVASLQHPLNTGIVVKPSETLDCYRSASGSTTAYIQGYYTHP